MVIALATSGEGGAGWPAALPLLPHPMEMLVGLIAFGILYWVYKTKVVPNMEKLYAERAEAIEGGIKKAEIAQAEANEAKAQFEAQLKESRADANRVREEARAQGAQIVAEMREHANAEAGRITEAAHKQIEAERQQAMVSLRGDVGRISTDLASRIVGESLDNETRQKGLVEKFLADLDSGDIVREKVGKGGTA